MAKGKKPDDYIFISQDGKNKPLGEDGMSQLVTRLYKRGKIKGFTVHDLRRTFATQVTIASKDEALAIRLIRDTIPGVGTRYISYPLEQLVEALKKYSPVSSPKETEETVIMKSSQARIVNGGDGGELNSPSRRDRSEFTTNIFC